MILIDRDFVVQQKDEIVGIGGFGSADDFLFTTGGGELGTIESVGDHRFAAARGRPVVSD